MLGEWEMFFSRVLCLSIATKLHLRLFLQRNMSQNSFMPTTEQQTSLLILTIPEELFTMIASFMNTESQLALAYTCKTIYDYYKQQHKILTLLCDSRLVTLIASECIKTLERCMGQTGWAGVKVILKLVSVDPQNNYKHPIGALCLDEPFQLPNGLDCASLNALIIESYWTKNMPNISFLETFTNLKSLILKHVSIDHDEMLTFSKFPLLKFISLNRCKMFKVHLSKIFKVCTALEEIHLILRLFR